MLYIGKGASSLPADLDRVNSFADEEAIGYTLGTVMTKILALGDAMGVSGGASNAIKGAVSRFQDNYMSPLTARWQNGVNTLLMLVNVRDMIRLTDRQFSSLQIK